MHHEGAPRSRRVEFEPALENDKKMKAFELAVRSP